MTPFEVFQVTPNDIALSMNCRAFNHPQIAELLRPLFAVAIAAYCGGLKTLKAKVRDVATESRQYFSTMESAAVFNRTVGFSV